MTKEWLIRLGGVLLQSTFETYAVLASLAQLGKGDWSQEVYASRVAVIGFVETRNFFIGRMGDFEQANCLAYLLANVSLARALPTGADIESAIRRYEEALPELGSLECGDFYEKIALDFLNKMMIFGWRGDIIAFFTTFAKVNSMVVKAYRCALEKSMGPDGRPSTVDLLRAFREGMVAQSSYSSFIGT